MEARPEALPNLLIAGVPKGGTTSLFRWLSQHPAICASHTKELRYFDPVRYGEQLDPPETYARHFDHWSGEPYRMEATPGYFSGGRDVATAVQEVLDDAHVLVSLRDPVERCWSWYRFVRARAHIPREMGFAQYVDICEEQRADGADALRVNRPFYGLRAGCYDEWIDAWQELFGSRLRVVFFDDLVTDAPGVVTGIVRWLELDDRVVDDFRFDVENRSVPYRNRYLLQAALALNRRGERFFERHRGVKRILRGAYYKVNRDAAPEVLDPGLRARLTDFYAPHNARLAARLRSTGAVQWPAWLPAADLPTLPAPGAAAGTVTAADRPGSPAVTASRPSRWVR